MSTLLTLLVLSASGVSQVVVYPDRAQVTRSLELPCGPTSSLARFEHIPPAALPTSVRAHVEGGSVDGLRTETKTLEAQYAQELSALEEKITKAEQEQAALRDEQARAQSKSRLGSRYAEVAVSLASSEMAEARSDPKAWSSALDVSLEARKSAAARLAELDSALRQKGYELEDLRIKYARRTAGSRRNELYAEVLVSCPSSRTAKVELTYWVGGASWRPAYEARADETAGAVELSTFATVSQSTGEDWAGAQVILSTAVPSQNATPPELSKLMVYAEERKEQKKVLVRREERIEHAQSGEAGDADAAGLQARSQGLSVQLSVPEAATVRGDAVPARLFVGKVKLKARFVYRAVPKLMPFVFRVAELTNRAPYPLLSGPLDTFRQGAFLGRSLLERISEGGAFELSFGLDDKLRAERSVIEEVSRAQGLFGGAKRFGYAYRFTLANWGKKATELEVSEHIPVSELDDVKVALADKTSPGYSLSAEDGVVKWKLKLEPRQKKELVLAFHVDVPAAYETGGL